MGKNKVFLDSSALIAYLRKKDSCHQRALKIWGELREKKIIFVITNYIFAEFLTVVRQRIGVEVAVVAGALVRQGKIFEKIQMDRFLEEKAWQIFKKSKIKNLSFVDCTSFACMETFNLKRVFTFDKHFQKSGFEVLI